MRLLTVKELAEVLKVTPARIYSLAHQQLIPAVRIGRSLRFSADAIDKFVAAGGKGFAGGWRKKD